MIPVHKTRQIQRIVEATLRLIHDEGLSNASMSKVAAQAGMTRQTLYNYFPDVESIVAHTLVEHGAAVEQRLLVVVERADGLLEKLRAVAEFQISHASPGHAAFSLESGLSAQVRARLASYTDTVKDSLEKAAMSDVGRVASGDAPAEAVISLLWGMLEGAVAASLKHPEQKPFLLDAVVRAMFAVVRGQD